MPSKGGFKQFMRKAKAAQATGATKVSWGYFQDARYQDGTPVTNVAAWQEFGVKKNGKTVIPERPTMRPANADVPEKILPLLKREVDPRTMVVSKQTAGRVGETMKSDVQERITNLKQPPNAEETPRRKAPKDNPLIETAFMRASVSYEVD